jgi:hypothetical protein
MAHRLPTPPSPQDLAKALNALLREFDPRTTSFPDPTGRWREAPATLQDRIVHHLLFHLTQLGPEVLSELQAQAFASFLNLEAWPGILVLAETSSASSTGLGFIRGLARLLQAETLRFESEQPAASWNSKEKKRTWTVFWDKTFDKCCSTSWGVPDPAPRVFSVP